MKVAVSAYPVSDRIETWSAYREKTTRWVGDARDADLLVFPEYGAMELALLAGEEAARDPVRALAAVSDRVPEVNGLHAELARRFGVHILAGSMPVRTDRGFVNRAHLFAPSGDMAFQDKQIPTPYEREVLGLVPGEGLSVIETPIGSLGVLICYDCEFPLLARALIDAGAEIILVPACTDGVAGHHRVATGARARALENQCFVAHACTIGTGIDWCPVIDENRGAAAVYAPPDPLTAETGVLRAGAMDTAGWVVADLDLAAARAARHRGETRNHAHWREQQGRIESIGIRRLA